MQYLVNTNFDELYRLVNADSDDLAIKLAKESITDEAKESYIFGYNRMQDSMKSIKLSSRNNSLSSLNKYNAKLANVNNRIQELEHEIAISQSLPLFKKFLSSATNQSNQMQIQAFKAERVHIQDIVDSIQKNLQESWMEIKEEDYEHITELDLNDFDWEVIQTFDDSPVQIIELEV